MREKGDKKQGGEMQGSFKHYFLHPALTGSLGCGTTVPTRESDYSAVSTAQYFKRIILEQAPISS